MNPRGWGSGFLGDARECRLEIKCKDSQKLTLWEMDEKRFINGDVRDPQWRWRCGCVLQLTLQRNPSGSFGFTIAASHDYIYVSRVDPRTPAFTSGLCVGDHVVRVNGCDVTAANLLDVASLVRWTTTSCVTVSLMRGYDKLNINAPITLR